LGLLKKASIRMNDNLGDTIVVSQVNKEYAAVIALAKYPPRKPRFATRVFNSQRPACVCSVWMHDLVFQVMGYEL
jgi:hypothetical protein